MDVDPLLDTAGNFARLSVATNDTIPIRLNPAKHWAIIRRGARLADGELSTREAGRVLWDLIVAGTGMGGGMLGYSLA